MKLFANIELYNKVHATFFYESFSAFLTLRLQRVDSLGSGRIVLTGRNFIFLNFYFLNNFNYTCSIEFPVEFPDEKEKSRDLILHLEI